MPIPEHIRKLREHVGNSLLFVPAVTALVFNDQKEVLLGLRSDMKRWAVIGGILEPGESPAEAVLRELLEETGVVGEIERLVGVYAPPKTTYPNGDQTQFIVTTFRCRHISGTPRVADDESLDVRYFPLDELPDDLSPSHRQRILDAVPPGKDLPAIYR